MSRGTGTSPSAPLSGSDTRTEAEQRLQELAEAGRVHTWDFPVMSDGHVSAVERDLSPEVFSLLACLRATRQERDEAREARRWFEAGNASLQHRLGLANDAADEAVRRLEETRAALQAYEMAVQRALRMAPNHWHEYRDPFELSPDIRSARALARAVLAAVPADNALAGPGKEPE